MNHFPWKVSAQDVIDRLTLNPARFEERFFIVNDKNGNSYRHVVDPRSPVGELEDKVRLLDRDTELVPLVHQVSKLVTTCVRDDLRARNIKAFVHLLPPDLKLVIWNTLATKLDQGLNKWIHPYLAEEIVTGIFRVPVGEAGVGVPVHVPCTIEPKFRR